MGATARWSQTWRDRASRGPGSARRRPDPERDGALRYLVDFLDAFLWRADPATLRFTFVTRSAEELLGYPVERWIGGPEQWGELIDEEDRDRVIEELRRAAADGGDHEIEFRVNASDGRTVWLRHAVRTVTPTSRGRAAELWGLTTDITANKWAEVALRRTSERNRELSAKAERFRRQALRDALTDLPNRILFDDRLSQSIREAERAGGRCAVLLIDLDRFKEINDTYGHQAGDRVLQEVAVRLRVALRRPDTAARLGGDEFAAVMPGADEQGATKAAERMLRAMNDPCAVEGKPLDVRASIGIAVYPDHGKDPAELLRRADQAMYRAKNGRTGHAISAHSHSEEFLPRPRVTRWKRWTLVLAAATFGLSSWTYSSVAYRTRRVDTAATRLDAVTNTLARAAGNDRAVTAALTAAEQTLDKMSWDQLRGSELLTSLTLLHRRLLGIRPHVSQEIRGRVQQLTVNVEQTEAAALIKWQQPSGPALSPKPVARNAVD